MAIDSKLGYSQRTQDLIDRQCRNVERKDFRLGKKKGAELILKTYDLFNLKRPSKVVWYNDIFDDKFAWSAKSAGSAWSATSATSAGSAGSAWSARSAGSARSATSAGSARSAWSAGSAWSAKSAGSAWSATSAGSTRSAWSAGSALDYDFDWYVYEFEYCENPDEDRPINENDTKYLEYCELLMQAKEVGVGYRVEWEDVLYLVPTPLVELDTDNKWHSLTKPAIRWKGGKEFYYLSGVNFDKKLWSKIVNNKMSAKSTLAIENMEQRMAALKVKGAENLLDEIGGKMINQEGEYELYKVEDIFTDHAYFLKYSCPSTGRVYVSGIDPEVGKKSKAIEAIAWKFGVSVKEYKSILKHA